MDYNKWEQITKVKDCLCPNLIAQDIVINDPTSGKMCLQCGGLNPRETTKKKVVK